MVALLRTGRRPWVEYAERVEELGSAAAVLDEEPVGSDHSAWADEPARPPASPRRRPGRGPRAGRRGSRSLERGGHAPRHRARARLSAEPPRGPRPTADGVRGGPLDAGGLSRGGGRRSAQGDARRHCASRRDRRASRRPRIHRRLGACGRHRHGCPHRGAGPRGPDGRGDRDRACALLPAPERRAPAPHRLRLRGHIAVLAGCPAQPAQLPDAQRRDVRRHPGDGCGRGVGHERRADAGTPRPRAGAARVPPGLAG